MSHKINNSLPRPAWLRIWDVLKNPKYIAYIWLIISLFISVKKYFSGSYNNYNIFKYTYYHAAKGLNLYAEYPGEYLDSNHYGPFFSMLMAPFALMPNLFGMVFWQLANVLFLYFAIKKLPLEKEKISIIYWVVLHELITAMLSFQFNISITAIIILSYALIEKKQNFWATFVIMLGTFVKLYGIVGLAFFFFAKEKPKFVLYCFFWAIALFVAPMLLFSPQFVVQSYQDWYISLSEKQSLNASLTSMQDISLMGMVRRISGDASIPNLPFLIGGLLIFILPYLRFKEYKSEVFRLYYLASVLIFTVIFSNSSESPTYIIAFAGVAIWFVIQDKPISTATWCFFIFALILTSFSPSDLFPRYIRNEFVRPYSLKALPCVLIWFIISNELLFKKFCLMVEDDE